MRQLKLLIIGLIIVNGPTALAAELTKATADGFDRYIGEIEANLDRRSHANHFLSAEDAPEWRERLRQGAVLVQPTHSNGIIAVQGGLIQDWVGAVFVPHASLKNALAVAQDYEHHGEIYKPEIAHAKVLNRSGDQFRVYMRIVKSKLLFSDVLNTEHDIQFTTLDPRRAYSRSYSRRIAEVVDAGKPREHELAVGQDRGFLWRIYGYWFFEEGDDGVYISCQSITLTRDMSFALKKILEPIVRDLPGESIRTSLEQTRKAIASR